MVATLSAVWVPCTSQESQMHGALVTLQPGLDWWSQTLHSGNPAHTGTQFPLLACFLHPRLCPEALPMQTLGAPELLPTMVSPLALHTWVPAHWSQLTCTTEIASCLSPDCGLANFSAIQWQGNLLPGDLNPSQREGAVFWLSLDRGYHVEFFLCNRFSLEPLWSDSWCYSFIVLVTV